MSDFALEVAKYPKSSPEPQNSVQPIVSLHLQCTFVLSMAICPLVPWYENMTSSIISQHSLPSCFDTVGWATGRASGL